MTSIIGFKNNSLGYLFRQQQGGILIYLVAVILVGGTLGAGMVSLTTTSTFTELSHNASDQARYLAQAGLEYAENYLKSQNADETTLRDAHADLHGKTFTLAEGGQFRLEIPSISISGEEATFATIQSTGRIFSGTSREANFVVDVDNYLVTINDESNGGVDIENIFILGDQIGFAGNTLSGDNATIVITGDLNTADTNLGSHVGVSTIYVDGNAILNTGSASLGSITSPGAIYVNGNMDLWIGSRNIYGDVYVNGNFRLKDARIHGNVYVNGDVELGWTPYLSENSRIYYTGTLTHPNNYNASILAKCIHQASVPGFTMPNVTMPALRDSAWYAAKGYSSSGTLESGLKIFTEGNYVSSNWRPTAHNVIIVSKGDISITGLGGSGLSGFLFAPFGKVTFNGAFFEGFVLTKDGFFVTSGGTTVTYKSIEEFIANPSDYPFT